LRKTLERSMPAWAAWIKKDIRHDRTSRKNMLGRTFCPLGDAAAMRPSASREVARE